VYVSGTAVYGSAGTAWNVTNLSDVEGVGTAGSGIVLAEGGRVVNGSASAVGALILSGGASGAAIDIRGASGSVTNFGEILGDSSYPTYGILLEHGGRVANGTAGDIAAMIYDRRNAVTIAGESGTIANFGTIAGPVALQAGGRVVNGSSSSTAAAVDGIDISGGTGRFINFGRAGHAYLADGGTVTNDGQITNFPGVGVFLADGSVANQTNGAIDAWTGISIAGQGTVTNFGTISGYRGILLESGRVTNGSSTSASALIDSDQGVFVYDGGVVTNFGTIAAHGGGAAIEFFGTAAGTVVDFGTIRSHRAILFGDGDDLLVVEPGAVLSGNVTGGPGSDTVKFVAPGTPDVTHLFGIENIVLANGGANALDLSAANFSGVLGHRIKVSGGDATDTLSEAGVPRGHKAVLLGKGGDDRIIAAQSATMTGGAGSDLFVFTVPGSAAAPNRNTVTDFVHGTDKLAFSNAGFGLSLAGATDAPQALPAELVSSRSDGAFDTGARGAAERFAYNAPNGQLIFDADGNACGSTQLTVATLTGHRTVTAGDLFYVS
jgi:hypothetical protein